MNRRYVTILAAILVFSFFGLYWFVKSFPTTGQRDITVDCNKTKPTADPDPAGAYLKWNVKWEEINHMDFTIKFRESNPKKSPFRHFIFFPNKVVHSKKGATGGHKAVVEGDFYYDIICSNGNHVDPRLNVPPN